MAARLERGVKAGEPPQNINVVGLAAFSELIIRGRAIKAIDGATLKNCARPAVGRRAS